MNEGISLFDSYKTRVRTWCLRQFGFLAVCLVMKLTRSDLEQKANFDRKRLLSLDSSAMVLSPFVTVRETFGNLEGLKYTVYQRDRYAPLSLFFPLKLYHLRGTGQHVIQMFRVAPFLAKNIPKYS